MRRVFQASQSPAHLIIAGRNESKVRESINALQAQFPDVDCRLLNLDLSSQKAVRNSAAKVLSWSDIPAIDIVVNSAGVAFLPERVLSEDGLEMHFATNHIGHFLFTCLIMPKLIKAAQGSLIKGSTRIVNLTSLSPTWAHMRWSDINFDKKNKDLPEEEKPPYSIHRAWGATGDLEEQSYLPLEGYNQSKVANVLFSIGLSKRLYDTHGILSLAVHPGVISTELGRNMAPETAEAIKTMLEGNNRFYRTLEAGSATSIVAALDPKLGPGELKDGEENYGIYLADCQISEKAKASSLSSDGAERLWKISEDLVKEKFSW